MPKFLYWWLRPAPTCLKVFGAWPPNQLAVVGSRGVHIFISIVFMDRTKLMKTLTGWFNPCTGMEVQSTGMASCLLHPVLWMKVDQNDRRQKAENFAPNKVVCSDGLTVCQLRPNWVSIAWWGKWDKKAFSSHDCVGHLDKSVLDISNLKYRKGMIRKFVLYSTEPQVC